MSDRVAVYKNMTDQELLPYLAGFFDGEGTISISRVKKSATSRAGFGLAIQVSQNERAPLELFLARFGGKIYSQNWKKATRVFYSWQLTNSATRRTFLESISKYLVVKKREAEIALAFLSTVGPSGGSWLSDEESDKRNEERLVMWAEAKSIKRKRTIIGIREDCLEAETATNKT